MLSRVGITCVWSRAINSQLCLDLTVSQFLKAVQQHIFEFGTPEMLLSDLGLQLLAGCNIIGGIIKDTDVATFLKENGINRMSFSQYSKGNHDLGGLIEPCKPDKCC